MSSDAANDRANKPAKVCPLMSDSGGMVSCIEHRCACWVTVYTVELGSTAQDCAFALMPQMSDGLLRL